MPAEWLSGSLANAARRNDLLELLSSLSWPNPAPAAEFWSPLLAFLRPEAPGSTTATRLCDPPPRGARAVFQQTCLPAVAYHPPTRPPVFTAMSGAHVQGDDRPAPCTASPAAAPSSYAQAYDAHQALLPRLPIPALASTCSKLLEWAAPLLTADEAEESFAAVREFQDDAAQGPKLQQLLREYDDENAAKVRAGDPSGYATYFEEFWNDAYLAPKSSVVLNLNPFFVLEDDPRPIPLSRLQCTRAATLVFSSLKFVSDLRRGIMRADMGRRNTPLCMSQFTRLFSTARIATPAGGSDRIETDDAATHVVVLCRGQFYYFDALWPTGEVAISEVGLLRNFEAILDDAENLDAVACAMDAVGVLTAEDRDQWGRCRAKLAAVSPKNAEVLQIVDTALFVVCLDDCAPETLDDRAANMLHGSYNLEPHTGAHEGVLQTGTLTNRWYDKLQLIICGNGAAGINFEHSAVDGHTVLRFASDTFADTIVQFARSITYSTHGKDYLDPVCGKRDFFRPAVDKATGQVLLDVAPRKMDFELDLELRKAIHYSETKISDQVLQNELRVLEFRHFGKRWMVSHNVSPDAFVQVAMCTAYYILYGHFASQYESVMTKPFLHGRTEAGRSCTKAAAEFAQAWVDTAAQLPGVVAAQVGARPGSRDGNHGRANDATLGSSSATKLRKLFAAAIKAQQNMVGQCARGLGVDRHLYGLQCQAARQGLLGTVASTAAGGAGDKKAIPLFTCPAYTKLTSTVLSTSNCGNPSLQLFGFGPVSAAGYGIGYIIKDNGIQFCICSKHRQTARYVLTLSKFLLSMKQLLHEEVRVAIHPYAAAAAAAVAAAGDGNPASPAAGTDDGGEGKKEVEHPPRRGGGGAAAAAAAALAASPRSRKVLSAANQARVQQLASVGSSLDSSRVRSPKGGGGNSGGGSDGGGGGGGAAGGNRSGTGAAAAGGSVDGGAAQTRPGAAIRRANSAWNARDVRVPGNGGGDGFDDSQETLFGY